VFFIGDSGHIVPIFGVRGLNNGFADAHNIGWKLGLVLGGEADAALLDSYTPERRGATLDVFANAGKSTRFMTPPSRGWQLAREAALSLSLRHDFPKGLANPRQMQPYTYADSPLTPFAARDAEFSGGPSCGAAAPNARIGSGHLLDLAGDGYTALVFGASPAFDAVEHGLRAIDRRFVTLRIGQGQAIPDADGLIATTYGAADGAVYLLRPDQHVAGRWRAAVPAELETCLRLGFGRSPT
jgi:3-(3-hydroxy-phenyl)propionate hydroxylase